MSGPARTPLEQRFWRKVNQGRRECRACHRIRARIRKAGVA